MTRTERIYLQVKANAERDRVAELLKRPVPQQDFYGTAFPFSRPATPHVCPTPRLPEPPKFTELLRLEVRPELKGGYRQSWEMAADAPTLPKDREWFNDVLMAVRTASLVGKRVQLKADGGVLVLEVEK